MAETNDQETEAMVIRPPKAVVKWLRQRAAEEMQQGRTTTANKIAVAELEAAMMNSKGGRQK